MSHHRSKTVTRGYEAGVVRLDFRTEAEMETHSRVVQMDGWRLRRRLSTGDPELVAAGVGFELPACERFQLELPEFRDSAGLAPVAYVALVNAKSLSGGDLSTEMLDDFRVGHGSDYRPTDIGMAINSHNDRGNIREMEAIGDRIKRLRLAAGMTQITLAKAIGVSQGVVSNIENGAGFEASTLMAISKALLKSPQYVMTGIEEANELSDVEAKMIAAFRQAQPKEDKKGPTLKKTAEDKAMSSPMSKPKTKRRAA